MTRSLSASQARRIALAAQGFRDPRPGGKVDRRHLRRVMGRLGLLQLDSVPVVMRTQYMPLFARLGPYDPDLLDRVAYRDDEWFETWCHEASLMPIEDEPLMRWHKSRCASGQTWKGLVEYAAANQGYLDEVLDQVRERPLAPGELADPRPRDGEWWGDRSEGSTALDWLFRVGEVGIRRRPGFVKEFDLMDRIVPAEIRAVPTPSEEEAHRELLRRAARSLGVAAAPDLVDYHRLPKRPAKERVAELVEAGELEAVEVEGWDRPALLHPDASLPRAIDACALLSPFDPVVWFRERGERLFDFEYKIEIYTPAAKRRFGYYVLPFLMGDRIVGRLDAKTDRTEGVFRVFGAFAEAGVDHVEAADGLARALDDLTAFVGVDGWRVEGDKGELIGLLAHRQDASR
ncbi:MAG: crosslink repair DNA glycosylase YcaQ family protein [Actinomycetota bacterium]